MPQYFPNALKYFQDFKAARQRSYEIACDDLNPRGARGYGYRQLDEDDRESLYASMRGLVFNLGGDMQDLLVPEEHPTPQRAISSILEYRDTVLRDLEEIEAMAKRYSDLRMQPPPITYILGYERDVVAMLDHILNMDEIRPYLPADLSPNGSTASKDSTALTDGTGSNSSAKPPVGFIARKWKGLSEGWQIAIVFGIGTGIVVPIVMTAWTINATKATPEFQTTTPQSKSSQQEPLFQDLNGDGRGNAKVTYNPSIHLSKEGFVQDSSDTSDDRECLLSVEPQRHVWYATECAASDPFMEVTLLNPSGDPVDNGAVTVYTPEGWSDLVLRSIQQSSLMPDSSGVAQLRIRTSRYGIARIEFVLPERFSEVDLASRNGLGFRFIPPFGDDERAVDTSVEVTLCKACDGCMNETRQ